MRPFLGRLPTLFLGLMIVATPIAALADPRAVPPALRHVGFDQRLNEQVPLDLAFTDEQGKPVRLGDYFGEKAVILVLAYYQCPMLCTQVLNGLVAGLREMPFVAGREFQIVTVSFDPRERPAIAAAKKQSYLAYYDHAEAASGWHFLTGEPEAIAGLTDAVGFRYRYDPKTQQFAHAAGILILTPQGKISRYFYDVLRYSGRDLRLGLVEASENKIGSPVDQVLLYCFHYDPTTGKYGAAIMNFVRLGGVATVLALGCLLVFLSKGKRRKSADSPVAARSAALDGQPPDDPSLAAPAATPAAPVPQGGSL